MPADLTGLLLRLVTAVERLAPPILPEVDLGGADAFVWEAQAHELRPVAEVAGVPLALLVGFTTPVLAIVGVVVALAVDRRSQRRDGSTYPTRSPR